MENKFSNTEFEEFVKENADQYRMFPSDKVWNGINNALHTRRKWYGFWLGFLLLLTGGSVTWVMSSYPSSKKSNTTTLSDVVIPNTTKDPAVAEQISQDIKDLLPFAKTTVANTGNDFIVSSAATTNLKAIPGGLALNDKSSVPPIRSSVSMDIVKNSVSSLQSELPLAQQSVVSFPTAPVSDLNIDNETKNRTSKEVINIRKTEMISPLLTIESVTNAYAFKKPAKRISWQLFVTPTVSYRKLSVNKSSNNPSAFNYPFASLSDINSAVTHKPDLGLQIGVMGRYPITKALKLRGGLQFNINRYDIKAYAFNGEVATIDLNGGSGASSISTWTNYRNFAGYKSDWLKNYYFSVSAPIGAELKLVGNKKTNFGIAGTIQPSYILQDRAYLISTDYKNYAEVPRLIRHVNLNTSFETFVNYTSGKTQWQVGPQVRYQILSSFHNTYPVKENLFDFGVKVGVTLNQ
ncbi:MAG: hypothetical protein EOO94_01660 [Pedobacter sp.]|nr:MAG: hypothetical protein EOO94_01660 [Pedobacter sp.]